MVINNDQEGPFSIGLLKDEKFREEAMVNKLKTLLILLTIIVTQNTLGNRISNAKIKYDKIPLDQASNLISIRAFQTFHGEIFKFSETQIRDPKNLRNLLRSSQIELKGGPIIYPEEIEYLLRLKRQKFDKAPHEKAPHERSLYEKAPHSPF